MTRERRLLTTVLLATAALALALAGCGGSDEAPSTVGTTETTDTETTETTETQVAATVTSFVVGTLTCDGEDGSMTVSWTTSAATAVRLDVDGEEAAETGPSGTEQLDVPCDGQEHRVSATPLSDEGEGQPVSRTVGPATG